MYGAESHGQREEVLTALFEVIHARDRRAGELVFTGQGEACRFLVLQAVGVDLAFMQRLEVGPNHGNAIAIRNH